MPINRTMWLVALVIVSLAHFALAQENRLALHECPDITGTWSSGSYEVLSVQASGESTELRNLSMKLDVDDQHGCHFVGVNRWTNGEIGGTERVAGILNPIGHWITMIEVTPHPDSGTTGRIFGRLIDETHINWEYAAYSSDGERANVFSTVLSRGDTPVVRETCPDLTGTWTSHPYTLLEVAAVGSARTQAGPQGTLTIARQSSCHIDGTVSWTANGKTEHERIAGALHTDGKLITILGVGDHPDNGTRAYIHAEVIGPDSLEWDFVGISDDEQLGHAFTTLFTRNAASAKPLSCPWLAGTWKSSQWEGLEATGAESVDRVTRDYKLLVIKEQVACTVWGEMTFGPHHGQEAQSDRFIGVINGVDRLLMTRTINPHPEDGHFALALHRLQSDTHMITEYTGEIARGGGVFVHLQDLDRQ